MSTFLKLMPIALAEVKQYHEPTNEVAPEDTVIGVLENDHKALYTLWLQTKREADLKGVEARYESDPEERERMNGKAYELGAKAQCVYELMWIAINDHFGVWPKMFLMIRKGWVLVQTPPPKQSQWRFGWPFAPPPEPE